MVVWSVAERNIRSLLLAAVLAVLDAQSAEHQFIVAATQRHHTPADQAQAPVREVLTTLACAIKKTDYRSTVDVVAS